jgi:hypothetical protein
MLPTKFQFIWLMGFRGEDSNVKSYGEDTLYQRQCELLPSLGVCRPLTFRILIFSSETS